MSSAALSVRILTSSERWSTFQRTLAYAYDEHICRLGLTAYHSFISRERAASDPKRKFIGNERDPVLDDWPAWLHIPHSGVQSAPSTDTIQSHFQSLAKTSIYYIKKDMMGRTPGRCASSDATYEMASRTRYKDTLGTEAGCITFVMGSDHCYNRWYATDTESFEDLAPGLQSYRDTLECIYVEIEPREWVSALSLLVRWDDDRCCNGNADPTDHPVPRQACCHH